MSEKKLAVLIATYNRPQYLKRCLESVAAADLSQVRTIMIVDDHSTDRETINLINDFELPQVELIKAFSPENRSIKYSLQLGFDLLFLTHTVCTNLDGDAIVSPDAFNRLIAMQKRFTGRITTGFNCRTKNKDGSERHVVVEEKKDYNTKKSVGGINMIFNSMVYAEIVKPALAKSLKNKLNWDHQACLTSVNGYGRDIICLKPSVVQHIGVESSMGHSAGGEPPDIADDFVKGPIEMGPVGDCIKTIKKYFTPAKQSFTKYGEPKLELSNVTLVGADCIDIKRLLSAADKCMEKIEFRDVHLFSSISYDDPRVTKCRHIPTKEDYSQFIMKEMPGHILTTHMLIIQHDGYILNPAAWDPAWLEYDYIGAPWEWYADGMQVGNGGFSLRSKKLMDIIADTPDFIPVNDHLNLHKEEDHCIARIYRKRLESEFGIKFAPLEIARKFSIEGYRSANKTWTNEFGFHGLGLTNVKP